MTVLVIQESDSQRCRCSNCGSLLEYSVAMDVRPTVVRNRATNETRLLHMVQCPRCKCMTDADQAGLADWSKP